MVKREETAKDQRGKQSPLLPLAQVQLIGTLAQLLALSRVYLLSVQHGKDPLLVPSDRILTVMCTLDCTLCQVSLCCY